MSESELRPLRWRRMAYVPQSALASLVPVHSIRRQFRDTACRARHARDRGRCARGGAAAPGRARSRRARSFPARAVRRHAAARHHRAGAAVPTAAAGGRRAHHGARRHRAAPDREPARRSATQRGAVAALHQPRYRRRGASCASGWRCCTPARSWRRAPPADVLCRPAHPYTMGLAQSFPDIRAPDRPLVSIAGHTAPADAADQGCPFATRCPFVRDICRTTKPARVRVALGPLGRLPLSPAKQTRMRQAGGPTRPLGCGSGGMSGDRPNRGLSRRAQALHRPRDAARRDREPVGRSTA